MDWAVWCPLFLHSSPESKRIASRPLASLMSPLVSGTASLPVIRREGSKEGEEMYYTRQANPSQTYHSAYKRMLDAVTCQSF